MADEGSSSSSPSKPKRQPPRGFNRTLSRRFSRPDAGDSPSASEPASAADDASEPEPADDEGAAGEASGSDDGDAMDEDWKAPAKASLPAAKKPKLERQLPDRHLSTEELEEWTQLVLRCAKALGRSANNLPVYTSESSIALQAKTSWSVSRSMQPSR